MHGFMNIKYIDIDFTIILKLNLNKEPRRVWTGLSFLRMGTTGGLF
jgi:hypothetical protein